MDGPGRTLAGIRVLRGLHQRGVHGNPLEVRNVWQVEADRLDATPESNLSLVAIRRLLAIDLGDAARANQLQSRLAAAGYRDPRTDPAYTLSGAFN